MPKISRLILTILVLSKGVFISNLFAMDLEITEISNVDSAINNLEKIIESCKKSEHDVFVRTVQSRETIDFNVFRKKRRRSDIESFTEASNLEGRKFKKILFTQDFVDKNKFKESLFYGDLFQVILFLRQGFDVNSTFDIDHTPWVQRALWFNQKEMAKLFVEKHGADVNARNRNGVCALHVAVYKGYLGMIEFLLAHGVDVKSKQEAFALALHKSDGDALQVLVEKDPDLCTQDKEQDYKTLIEGIHEFKQRLKD